MFWWLLVAACVGFAIFGAAVAWETYHSLPEYTAYRVDRAALPKLPRATAQPPELRQAHRSPEAAAAARSALPVATAEPNTTSSQEARSIAEIRSAVDSWEASIRTRDQDFARLSGAVRRYAQALILERGVPADP